MNRQDLRQYKFTQEWIKGRLEYLEEYKETIEKITSTLSDMPKGSPIVQDKFAEGVATLIDSINELIDKINKQNEKQKQILEQVDKVEEPYRCILDKVYIQGKTLVTVASEMNYSYKQIKRNHNYALKKFDELCKMTPNVLECPI